MMLHPLSKEHVKIPSLVLHADDERIVSKTQGTWKQGRRASIKGFLYTRYGRGYGSAPLNLEGGESR